MGDGGNPFTPGEANPFTPDRASGADDAGPMAGGEASPSAVPLSTPSVPETTKPRQMPGGDSGGMDMGMGADPSGGAGGDSNVPQDSPPAMDKAATLRRITADILVTNPTLSTREAGLLAEEVVRRYPKVANVPPGLPQFGDLNDPSHPYWTQMGGHPYYTQQRTAPGGRNLQAHPQSQYPFIEDAANRATEWMTNKVKQKWRQRTQRTTGDPAPTPEQGSQPQGVPAVAPPAQGPWGTPAPSPAPGSVQTPAPNGWKPRPLPAAPQPSAQPQPSRAQQLRQRFAPRQRGRHAASLVYGTSED